MTGPRSSRTDLAWRRPNLAAILVMLAAGWGILAWQATKHGIPVGKEIPINQALIDRVKMRIDPNTASNASLRRMSGVGPVLARNIIDYRALHGPRAFATAEDLDKVARIGPALIQRIKMYLDLPSKGGDSAWQDETCRP